ncbi:class A beta-lactamase [Streptosporangium sandarakinum]|uniref:class A beta-lactamase n=1 Tax=Streptosporangium TaxID=2000 RepID=UPI0031F77084
MRPLHTRRFPAALKAAALTVSVLAGGTIYGPGTATAAVQTSAAAVHAPTAQVRYDRQAAAPSGQAEAGRRLRALEASFDGRIGVYAVDTATGKKITHRAGERFPLLSTFKAVAAAAVLNKARTTEPGLMDKVVHWTQDEVKENSPVTEDHVEDGLTVAELCEAAITQSDNTAGNMLLKQIGGPAGLTRYFRTLKDPISRLDRWETELNIWSPKEKRDTTTPAAVAADLRELTLGDALNAKDRARLNGWLRANKTGDKRIRAGLPKSWTIGDKTGASSYHGSTNDIAVVWPENAKAPLVMAIYTTHRAAKAPNDDKAVADTATIVAEALGKLPRS